MSGSGSSAVSRSHGEDRFYNPPAIRRHHQMMLQQKHQQQLQRAGKLDSAAQDALSESGFLTESDDSVMLSSQPPLVCTSSPTKPPPTNLDNFLGSVTPCVAVRQVKEMECRTAGAESSSFYFLGDLWDSFREWSAYGVGVQLLLNGEETIKQYYVPFLSGIQLYVDPPKHRQLFRQSMDTSHAKGDSQGHLLFEYLELDQPHKRRPINDMISVLASQFPELRKCRSCDLLPSSWISVAWYPIYRIPMGSTLRDLDASFLTFHYLSTHSRCKSQIQVNQIGVKNGMGSVDLNSKISLPVFGLATYKLKGSILTPCGPDESDKENSLLQAAERWLQQLEVVLPDYQFFRAQYSRLK